jgi:hypothetical protein
MLLLVTIVYSSSLRRLEFEGDFIGEYIKKKKQITKKGI